MLMVNQLVGFGAVTEFAADATITYKSTASNGSASSPVTFSSLALGTSGWNLVALNARSWNGSSGSMTIDGAAATLIGTYVTEGTNNQNVSFWIAPATANATGSVVFTGASLAQACVVVWHVTNLLSTTPTSNGTSTASPADFSAINVSAGGIVAAFGISVNGSTIDFANLTETSTLGVSGTYDTNKNYTGGAAAFAAAQSSLNIDGTYAGSPSGPVAAFIVLR